jgi:hypothetical protein
MGRHVFAHGAQNAIFSLKLFGGGHGFIHRQHLLAPTLSTTLTLRRQTIILENSHVLLHALARESKENLNNKD